jgi:hypothetical protein
MFDPPDPGFGTILRQFPLILIHDLVAAVEHRSGQRRSDRSVTVVDWSNAKT